MPSHVVMRAAGLIVAILLFSSQLALAQFTQQGPKLVGADAVAGSRQGRSVALSTDGNTAIVGGLGDNSYVGAAWVFTQGSESGLTNPLCAERDASLWLQAGSARLGCRAFLGSVIVL
jgi:FG-GAP repeat